MPRTCTPSPRLAVVLYLLALPPRSIAQLGRGGGGGSRRFAAGKERCCRPIRGGADTFACSMLYYTTIVSPRSSWREPRVVARARDSELKAEVEKSREARGGQAWTTGSTTCSEMSHPLSALPSRRPTLDYSRFRSPHQILSRCLCRFTTFQTNLGTIRRLLSSIHHFSPPLQHLNNNQRF